MAFGRTHRRRLLRQRLSSLAGDGPGGLFVARAGFLAAAHHMVDTGAVDAARGDMESLADALFAHDKALPLDDVLKAATSLDGRGHSAFRRY